MSFATGNSIAALSVKQFLLILFNSSLLLHEWPTSVFLSESEEVELSDHKRPVNVVCDDRSVGCRVCPSEDRIENGPRATTVEIRATAL